jgi:hypothetical protein
MSNMVAVRARHPRAFLLIGVHPRFLFLGRPGGAGGAGLTKHYQLCVLRRMALRCAPDRTQPLLFLAPPVAVVAARSASHGL